MKLSIRVLMSLLLWSGMCGLYAQTLKFNSDGRFKIVQFTDVHWVPGNEASREAEQRMEEVLDAEQPDLVVYTGDLVYGSPAAKALDEVFKPVVARGIPFAVTWGNHDDEHDLTRRQLSAYIEKFPGNLTSTVEGVSGVTNYVLSLKSSRKDSTVAVLYLFDSHSYSTIQSVEGYGWIHADQVEWYRRESEKMTRRQGGKPLPALAFFHIPLPEYHEAVQSEKALLVGTRKEAACAPEINTGLFAAMVEAKDVMGVFVGHDHVNDYVVNWHRILLGYGRFTGGKTVYHDIPGGNGARVIQFTEGEREFKTWIRLAGGKVIQVVDYPQDFDLVK